MSVALKPTQSGDRGLALRDAPARFFDAAKWHEMASYFADANAALRFLGEPEPSLLVFYRREAAKLPGGERARSGEKAAALAHSLVDDFLQRLGSGALVATALSALAVERVTIPQERWPHLRLNFSNDSAQGASLSFTAIRIYEPGATPPQPTLLDRCVAFLRQRSREGESRRKVLFGEALAHFGAALTTRTFGEAYKIVFAKPRGRPRKGDVFRRTGHANEES